MIIITSTTTITTLPHWRFCCLHSGSKWTKKNFFTLLLGFGRSLHAYPSVSIFEQLRQKTLEASPQQTNSRLPPKGIDSPPKLKRKEKKKGKESAQETTTTTGFIQNESTERENKRIEEWWSFQYGLFKSLDESSSSSVPDQTEAQEDKKENEKSRQDGDYSILNECDDGDTSDWYSNIKKRKDTLSVNVHQTLSNNRADALMDSLTQEDVESFPLYEEPFLDFTEMSVQAGSGGWHVRGRLRGSSSQGPSFGGNGGDVVLEAAADRNNLMHLAPKVTAKDGQEAWDTHRGLHARPRFIPVPLGTIVRRRLKMPSGEKRKYQYPFWHQFLTPGEQLLVAQGGKGGLAPSFPGANNGRKPQLGEFKRLQLELRLLNDATLLGFTNSGKTSLASSVTRYLGRIGPEPGSTTRPHIARIQYRDGINVDLCDLPALFIGAEEDREKGRQILRHLYRSKVFIYVLDMSTTATHESESDASNLLHQMECLRTMARRYNPIYEFKREMVVGTKCDMLQRESLFQLDSLYFRMKALYPGIPIVGTSARFGLGLQRFVSVLRSLVFPDLLSETNRVSAQPIESLLRPTKQDIQQLLETIRLDQLPPVILPPSKSETGLQHPPVIDLHPSYKTEFLPISQPVFLHYPK